MQVWPKPIAAIEEEALLLSLTHSLTHLVPLSLSYSLTHSLSLTHPLTQSVTLFLSHSR